MYDNNTLRIQIKKLEADKSNIKGYEVELASVKGKEEQHEEMVCVCLLYLFTMCLDIIHVYLCLIYGNKFQISGGLKSSLPLSKARRNSMSRLCLCACVVCMHIFSHMSIHICIYIYIYTHICIYIFIYIHICTHMNEYVHIHTYV